MAYANGELMGVEIGGTKLQVVVGNADGTIIDRWRGDVQRSEGRLGICRQIEGAAVSLRRMHPVQAIGVGFGGPVDWREGRTIISHQIDGWAQFDLRGWLARASGLPVAVDNDANVAALGETLAGAGRGRDPVFYVTLGSGVGAGCVVDGRIYHGVSTGEAEFGHLRLTRSGETVEQRCSGWAVDQRIRDAATHHLQSSLTRRLSASPGKESIHLSAALAEHDVMARQIMSEVAGDLGFALSHVVHLFHPAVIVIGGGLSLVGEALRIAIAAALAPQIMKAFLPGPEICLAQLREDAVPIGALKLAETLTRGTFQSL